MPRYAVLNHDWPTPHYDLLLQQGGVLKAWRLFDPPDQDQPLMPNAEHRLLYLDYEGEVSGGRGRVTAWDRGEFEWLDEHTVRLTGQILNGTWTLSDSQWCSTHS
jgi:hypothetical protein